MEFNLKINDSNKDYASENDDLIGRTGDLAVVKQNGKIKKF